MKGVYLWSQSFDGFKPLKRRMMRQSVEPVWCLNRESHLFLDRIAIVFVFAPVLPLNSFGLCILNNDFLLFPAAKHLTAWLHTMALQR